MIQLKDINKLFSNHKGKVLEDFNFQFLPNIPYIITGKNGSGKTTLLKLISGVLLPNKGEITIDKAERLGFVSSNERSFFGRLTAYENLEFFGNIDGINQQKIQNYIKESGDVFNFEKFKNKKFIHMSSGQKKKLAIMRAMLKEPKILILDEPFNFLDEHSKQKLSLILNSKIKNKGTYLIIASHDDISNYFESFERIDLDSSN